jgi:methylenetetrahydrofolate reductase (NADPH)
MTTMAELGDPVPTENFEILCEIEPPTTPHLDIVREQIAVLQRRCDAFLVPDSHLGRATVSSLAVAHEVSYLQGRAVACLNARDRNLLGLRRDLLTALAYGVDELLFVYGDDPAEGERAPMTVKRMLTEVRELAPDLRVGVAADYRKPLPEWKRAADFVCTQVGFDPAAVVRWREDHAFAGQVYAGVVVLASDKMAHRLADTIPGLAVPEPLLDRLAEDPLAGVEAAIELLVHLRSTGSVDGVHLVPARRYREVAAALEGI